MAAPDLKQWAEAMRHADYKAWAQEALGDRRQVFARSTLQPPDAPLVFMAQGQAEQLRGAAHEGALICPVPGCPSPQLTTYASNERREHFVHRQTPADPGHHVAHTRLAARELLAGWAREQHRALEVAEDVEVADVPVAILVSSPTGKRVAICITYQRLGRDRWWEQNTALRADGVPAAWVFGLRPSFFEPPRASRLEQPYHAVARDRARGDVILDRALFREMRSEGIWPLLLSVERRQLGNIIPPRGKVAQHLQLRPPACRDGVQHLVVHDLTACKLTEHGIATSDIDASLLARIYQAARKPPVAASPPSPTMPRSRPPVVPTPRPPSSRPAASVAPDCRLPQPGSTATFGALLDAQPGRRDRAERDLKSDLYMMRISRIVRFKGPLEHDTPIERL